MPETRRGKVVVLPQFADYLKQLRKAAKRGGQKAIVKRATAAGFTMITLNRLKVAEAGIVSDLDPVFLQQLAAMYRVSYEEMVATLVTEKYGKIASGRDLIRHDPHVQRTSPRLEGGTVDSTADRLHELESQLEDRDATLRDIENVTRRLFALVTGDEGRAAPSVATKGRRPARKTRG